MAERDEKTTRSRYLAAISPLRESLICGPALPELMARFSSLRNQFNSVGVKPIRPVQVNRHNRYDIEPLDARYSESYWLPEEVIYGSSFYRPTSHRD